MTRFIIHNTWLLDLLFFLVVPALLILVGYLIYRLGKARRTRRLPLSSKILIISGEEDPVGRFGKGPRELLWMYKKLGVTNAKLKMFDHMRHEIHNENGKEEVWYLISKFLLA